MKHSILYTILGVTLTGLLISAEPAAAQNTRNLTLDEAIQMSLQNSKQLKLSHAKVSEATAVLKESKDNRLPDAKISGSYLHIFDPTIDLHLKPSSSTSGSGSTEKTSIPSVNDVEYGIANVSLPLFSGLRIKYGIESAKYLEQAAKLDAENDREAIIQNTIDAYNNLYKSNATVALVNENLKQSRQRVTDFSNLEQNGLMARNDLLKAELQASNIELTLMDAQNNYKIASINMDLMTGIPETTELVPDSNSFLQTNNAGTLEQWEMLAMQHRNDIAALSAREKAAAASIKSTKGEYYPGIALTGGYIAANIPNLITITNAVNVGVGLQYSLSSLWKTDAKVQQARAKQDQIIANEGIVTDAIHLQVSQAYQNYLLAEKKIDVYEKAVQQSAENYRISKNKYDNALVTTTDLLEADVAQLQAQLNFAASKSDAMVSYKKLQQVTGTLKSEVK